MYDEQPHGDPDRAPARSRALFQPQKPTWAEFRRIFLQLTDNWSFKIRFGFGVALMVLGLILSLSERFL
ncbi:MAG TPA: hypothetical protein GX718_05910 [Brevibacterium sp.]|nr:hypothetical protein [Brevibacterium sp.]